MNWTEGALQRHSKNTSKLKQSLAKARSRIRQASQSQPPTITLLGSDSPGRGPLPRSDLEEKRRKLLRRGDWVGTSIQKPLAIRFPAQASPSRKGKWGFRRQDEHSDNVWRQTFVQSHRLLPSNARHIRSEAQQRRIKVKIGSQTVRYQHSSAIQPTSSTTASPRTDTTKNPFSSPPASSGMLRVESSPRTLHQPVPRRFAQLHRFRQSSSVESAVELHDLQSSNPPLQQDHFEDDQDSNLESLEALPETPSDTNPGSEPVPAIFDGISSSECEPSPARPVEVQPPQREPMDADVFDGISMLAQASARESSPEATAGFTFAQPKPFKGRLAQTPKPENRPVVQLSVMEAPRRGRPQRKARDGRISIRGIGNYYDDPIE